jgi:hypothetical protein
MKSAHAANIVAPAALEIGSSQTPAFGAPSGSQDAV